MTAQTASRPRVGSPAMMAAVLIGSLAVGFVAGQAAPDLLEIGHGAPAVTVAEPPALTPADDYAIRHLPAMGAGAPVILTDADDWALRHVPQARLGPKDDYGLRHRTPGGE